MKPRLAAGLFPYLLILPAVVTLLFLFIYPILWNGYLSLHEVNFQTYRRSWPAVGLQNYWVLLRDAIFPFKFYQSLLVSLQFVGGSVLGQFVLGLALALALQARIRGCRRSTGWAPRPARSGRWSSPTSGSGPRSPC